MHKYVLKINKKFCQQKMKNLQKRRNCVFSIDVDSIPSKSKSKCSRSFLRNKSKSSKYQPHINYSKGERESLKNMQVKVRNRTKTLTHHEDIEIQPNKYYLKPSGRRRTYKESLLTERKGNDSSRKYTKEYQKHRMHTITHVENQNQSQRYTEQKINHQQSVIKGCIFELQNILVDINNSKNTHRRLLSQRSQKSYREISPLEMNKESPKKTQKMKIQKKDKIKEDQKAEGKTVVIKNTRKDSSFKSYLDFIKNRKRENKLNIVKNIRKGIQADTKKIKQTLNLIEDSRGKQNINTSCLDEEDFGECHTIEEKNQISCSSIQNINQSSFLSEFGKKILKEVREKKVSGIEKQGLAEKQEMVNNFLRKPSCWKKQKSIKNRSSIKNIFPEGFFI